MIGVAGEGTPFSLSLPLFLRAGRTGEDLKGGLEDGMPASLLGAGVRCDADEVTAAAAAAGDDGVGPVFF